jgi:hypothetical protein
MPYTGADADADLKVARDGIQDYLNANMASLNEGDQDSLIDAMTNIDQQRNAIATMGALGALDPTGALFPKLTQATQNAKARLDQLQQTQQAIAKAIAIAGDVVSLATSIATMNVNGVADSVTQLETDATSQS